MSKIKRFFYSITSKHAELAKEICEIVAASDSKPQNLVPKDYRHVVQYEVVSMFRDELCGMIDDLNDVYFEEKKRAGPHKYSIAIAKPTKDIQTDLRVEIIQYTVPIGYKILGNFQDSKSVYILCLVWEKHCVAILKGKLCTDKAGKYCQRDSAIKNSLSRLHCDEKYPLAFADFLCQCAMSEQGKFYSLKDSPVEICALLLVDEIIFSQIECE